MNYEDVGGGFEQAFKGKRVRVHQGDREFTGWAYEWYDGSLLFYEATEGDDDDHEVVLIKDFDVIEAEEGSATIRKVPVERLSRPPHDVRDYDSPEYHRKAREVNLQGHIDEIPLVREVSPDAYEVVSGHRQAAIADELGFSEIPVEILDVGEWEATRRFVYEYVPLPKERDGDRGDYYSDEEIRALFEALREKWSLSEIAKLYPLKPEVEACRTA